jgi:DNA modification methylase
MSLGPFAENSIVCGDCREVMAQMPDSCVDLTLTSPEFEDKRRYNGSSMRLKGDAWRDFMIEVFTALKRVTRPGGILIINAPPIAHGPTRSIAMYEVVVALVREVGWNFVEEYVWCRTGPVRPYRSPYRAYNSWDPLFWLSNGPDYHYYVPDENRRPYAPSTVERQKYPVLPISYAGDVVAEGGPRPRRKLVPLHPAGKLPSNVLHAPQCQNYHLAHPARMQPLVAAWHIRAATKEGELVFDPFAGSGTTLAEAGRLGRRYFGCDVNRDYAQMSAERLRDVQVEI